MLEGANGCDNGSYCTARLSVLPGGTAVDPSSSLVPSESDPVWQSNWGSALNLLAPPDADLPILAPGAYVVVWSVMAQPIATDPPTAPAALAPAALRR